jgi:oxidase EvaA
VNHGTGTRPPTAPADSSVVRRVAMESCDAWSEQEGAYAHKTGRFFRVVAVDTGDDERIMLDQPEVGVLAFLATKIGDSHAVLVQWKAEPGNVGLVQAAPTVQATRSNIDRAHGGRATLLLDEVLAPAGRMSDILGSEQGDRFLAKENRDILRLIEHPDQIRVSEERPDYQWIARDNLAVMLSSDFAMNTDARSVLSSSPWHLWMRDPGEPFLQLAELCGLPAEVTCSSWSDPSRDRLLVAEASARRLDRSSPAASIIRLDELEKHRVQSEGVFGPEGDRVLGWFDVRLPWREVPHWSQPLLEQAVPGRCALVIAPVGDHLMVGVRASIEPGWIRGELAPTLQTPVSDADLDVLWSDPRLRTLAAVQQSDEGGRFFESVVRYELAIWEGDPAEFGDSVSWLALGELEALARTSRATTNELRSCLSLLLAFA